MKIRHLVEEGTSKWVIGRNVALKDNSIHVRPNAIHIQQECIEDDISMVNKGRLSYVPLSKFSLTKINYVPVLSCLNGNTLSCRPWSQVNQIMDRVGQGPQTYI